MKKNSSFLNVLQSFLSSCLTFISKIKTGPVAHMWTEKPCSIYRSYCIFVHVSWFSYIFEVRFIQKRFCFHNLFFWNQSSRRKLSNIKDFLKVLFLQCSISGPACLIEKHRFSILRVNLDAEIKFRLFSGKYPPLLMFHLFQVGSIIFPLCYSLDPQVSTVCFATMAGNF